jgi:hypothetical protein
LYLSESKQGIKKEDLPTVNVLGKVARFAETGLKLLRGEENRQSLFDDLFVVFTAQMKFVQEEYAATVVQSTFDPTVSRFFRSLQRNTGFSPDAMENLRSAAAIASVYRPQYQRGGRGNRPPGRAGGYQAFDANRRDVYQMQASRGFPSRRGGQRTAESAQAGGDASGSV